MEIVLMVLLGLTFGSFINVLIYRLPRGEGILGIGWREEKRGRRDAIAAKQYRHWDGRSRCPHCGHALVWYDLIPLVSWLGLGGRCRYCQTAISWRYPLVELVIAGLLVGLGWIFGPAGTVWVVYGALLLGCAWGLTLLISRRGTLKSKLPFGTILALVALIYIYTSTWWPDWLAQELELIRNLWI